ncbi:MAG TPA: tetratricopeptide repeat protein [Methylomirabilota bacterium]|nr:tetratricopeptide repeat protein [Methylomirabilota bacterium]
MNILVHAVSLWKRFKQARSDLATRVQTRAEAGHPNAQFTLGERYYDGQGVPQDQSEAFHWVLLAAEGGHVRARTNVGMMLCVGRGAEKDGVEGFKWIHLAAEQGDANAIATRETLRKRLPPEQIAEALKRAAAYPTPDSSSKDSDRQTR